MPNRRHRRLAGKSASDIWDYWGYRYQLELADRDLLSTKKIHAWVCRINGCEEKIDDSIENIENRGHGCSCQGTPLREDLTRFILGQLTGKKFVKIWREDIRSPQDNPLQIDAYNEELDWAIEDNGGVHDPDSKFFTEAVGIHDRIKRENASKFSLFHQIPPKIPHDRLKLERHIRDFLLEKGGFQTDNEVDWSSYRGSDGNRTKLRLLLESIQRKFPEVRCEADNFDTTKQPLLWFCEKGHSNLLSYNAVSKAWAKREGRISIPCSKCNKKRYSIEEAAEHAMKHLGVCISTKLSPNKEATFRCKENEHVDFELGMSTIRQNPDSWCPACTGKRYHHTAEIVSRWLEISDIRLLEGVPGRNDEPVPVRCTNCERVELEKWTTRRIKEYYEKEVKTPLEERVSWCDWCHHRRLNMNN